MLNFLQRLRGALRKEQGTNNTVLRIRAVQTDSDRYDPNNQGVSVKKLDQSPFILSLFKATGSNNEYDLLVDADILIQSLQDQGLYGTENFNYRQIGNDLVYDVRRIYDGQVLQTDVTVTDLLSEESDTHFGTDNPPDNAFGNDGDEYISTTAGLIFEKVSGAWVSKVDFGAYDNQAANEVSFNDASTSLGVTQVQQAIEALKTLVDSNTGASHNHTNKSLLDTLTDAGGGAVFLADDGAYKAVDWSALSNKPATFPPDAHSHTASEITDFDTEVSANPDVNQNTTDRHIHSNKAILDNIINTGDGLSFLGNDGAYIELWTNISDVRSNNIGASNLFITDNWQEGVFIHDPSDTTSADNTGTVLVDNSGKRFKRVFTGSVNVRWFGAVGDGVADDTSAIQAAADYCLSRRSMSTTNGHHYGFMSLYIPWGAYRITSTISFTTAIGLKIYGDGQNSTSILFDTATDDFLFNFSIYLRVIVQDITFNNVDTITISGGKPSYTLYSSGSRINTAFNFNGNGGGTDFTMRNCVFRGWQKCFSTETHTQNEDNHVYYSCLFYDNDNVWVNSNDQAVHWTFFTCTYIRNGIVFKDPATYLVVNGGVCISFGDFLNFNGDASFFKAKDVKFENYQNIDNTISPRYIAMGGGASGRNIVFDHCSNRTGVAHNATLPSFLLQGLFTVKFRDCEMGGLMECHANISVNGYLSRLEFHNCEVLPDFDQTRYGSQGNRPLHLIIKDSTPGPDGQYINRCFVGMTNTSEPISVEPFVERVYREFSSNNQTHNWDLETYMPSPYSASIRKLRIIINHNTNNSGTINLYNDSSQSTLIGSISTGSNKSGVRQVIELDEDQLTEYFIGNTTNPLRLQFVSTNNMGLVKLATELTFVQSNF